MTSQVEILTPTEFEKDGLALIDASGAVWRTFARPWWDLASWIWWALTPGIKTWVLLRTNAGRVRVRAVLVAKEHVRIGTIEARNDKR